MMPDFAKLPDRDPVDPHDLGVRVLYVLMAILAAIMILRSVNG